MRLRAILYILLLISATLHASPPFNVSGRVFDGRTMEPMPGTSIIDAQGRVSSTDTRGLFSLSLPEGKQDLTFRYVGYETYTVTVVVHADSLLNLSIALEPVATEIDQVVVTAHRMEQPIAESTVSVSVLRPEGMASGHRTDATEILNRASGIEVLNGQASVRGGSGYSYGAGSRVMVLIDGLPALTPDAGSIRWHSLPLENLSQIEIIKGASSVLYGSSALNGIVNFRTAEPTKEGKSSVYAQTGIFDNPRQTNWIWWDAPRTTHTTSFSHSKQYGRTGISLGSFLMLDNGYRKLDDEKLGRLNVRLKRTHRKWEGVSYGLAMNGGMVDKHDFLLWEDAEYGALKQNPVTAAQMRGLFLFVDPFISYVQEGKQTHHLRMRFQASDNAFREKTQNNSTTRSMFGEYQVWVPASNTLNLNSGLLWYNSHIHSNFYGNHQGMNLAAYAQADVRPSEVLTLVAGLRIEYNSLDKISDKAVPLFRAGVNYRMRQATFLRASFGQGYRYPSIAEKFAATTIGAISIIPNPNIQPESGWNAEVGVKQGIISSRIDGLIDLAIFYGQNKDMIEYKFGFHRNPHTNVHEFGFRALNIEYSRVYGMELETIINHRVGRLNNTATFGYVFMHPTEFDPGTYRSTGDYLKFRRKHALSAGISSAYRQFEAGLYLMARSRILAIDDVFLNPATREQILPGFFDYWQDHNAGHILLDFSISYRITPGIKLSIAVKNMTNTEYMGRPGDIRPHRHFSARITLLN